ncbi:pentatricopeptide repeat-containing protein-like [Forsythia ovata]|uniref:Pentatricopeptide repeat-containing protein-like n=1 Tax=Forsythia ovata TaxID=205694 RepID=A0ABD1VEG1_9LAMI
MVSAAATAFSKTAQRGMLSSMFIHPPKPKPNYITQHSTQLQTPTPLEKFKTDCKSCSGINTNDALTSFDNMLQIKPSPPISSFNKLMGAVAKTKNYQDVIFMYHRMVVADLLPDYITLNILINCYCSLKMVDLGFAVMGGSLRGRVVRILLLLLH